tara:strand:- start:1212 stop:1469 length:258 start_codon:yes stop_codon:yes gene_type:complete
MKISGINHYKKDGTKKSKEELDGEVKQLLNLYRRENILINDKLFNLEHNVIPVKDELINSLKQYNEKLKKDIEELKKKKQGWLFT